MFLTNDITLSKFVKKFTHFDIVNKSPSLYNLLLTRLHSQSLQITVSPLYPSVRFRYLPLFPSKHLIYSISISKHYIQIIFGFHQLASDSKFSELKI